MHTTYPKTTHINIHTYLCVFKGHFVGIPQGQTSMTQQSCLALGGFLSQLMPAPRASNHLISLCF